LTTSATVKLAMCHDMGAWDLPLQELVRGIRGDLNVIAGLEDQSSWECVLMQGSGSFGVEAAVGTLTPRKGRMAVISNGAYGERMVKIAQMLGIDVVPVRFAENQPAEAGVLAKVLADDSSIHTVGMIHCETTTGLLNDIEALGEVIRAAGRVSIIDAMSSFGAYDIDLARVPGDVLISSANKCIEGVPGFSFVFAKRDLLERSGAEGWARSHCLDLFDQWQGFESGGKFRFTPPTQVLLGFAQALKEFFAEGGAVAREARYRANHKVLVEGMQALGFVPFLGAEAMSHIITTFHCPDDPAFTFQGFYDRLASRGMVIYPGKVAGASCFRIGNIGRLYPRDFEALLGAIFQVGREMGFLGAASNQSQ
jgi:2-aminoethylphosphonate-pyruvate transaminase